MIQFAVEISKQVHEVGVQKRSKRTQNTIKMQSKYHVTLCLLRSSEKWAVAQCYMIESLQVSAAGRGFRKDKFNGA